MSRGQGAENNDLDVDAEPGSLSDEEQSAGCCQTEPPSATCSRENSGGNPVDQEDEMSRGNEADSTAACQNKQTMKSPDNSFDNSQFQKMEFPRQQSSQSEGTDYRKEYPCQIFLPPELKQQHFDLLIIHADEDRPAAENLKNIMEALHAKSTDGDTTPITVGLTDEVALHVRSNVDWLDAALYCCTYIFVIFTQNLKNDQVLSTMMKASLWASFSEEKRNKFCPVYLEKGAKEELKLSAYINVLSSLNMWKDPKNYKELIVKYIDVAPRIRRCQQQDQEAKLYCDKLKDAAEYSAFLETTDFGCKFYKSETSSAPGSPVPSIAADSGYSEETARTPSTEFASDDSTEHFCPADFKSCPVKPEPCEENSVPDELSAAVQKQQSAEVESSPQTSPDWNRYLLMTTGAVLGVGLLYLFKKAL